MGANIKKHITPWLMKIDMKVAQVVHIRVSLTFFSFARNGQLVAILKQVLTRTKFIIDFSKTIFFAS